MLNYNLPLTEAESEFAAEHHSVIYGYLRKAGLPEDDFTMLRSLATCGQSANIWPGQNCASTAFPPLPTGP